MISLADDWVWDSWYVWQESTLHAFYLKAPKSLLDPNLRHQNARVGHSTSEDGISWQHHADALGPTDSDTFDNQAIWTGSIVRHDGLWHMFYTGIDRHTKGQIQRVGHATSPDLFTWTRVQSTPVITAQAPWYAVASTDARAEEPFRDPWVFWHLGEWHMLITARDASGATVGTGNMAHATSPDLYNWSLREPLIVNSGFDQLEVFEVTQIAGRWFVTFCMQSRDVHRPGVLPRVATYAAPAASPLGPYDLDAAHPIPVEGGLYAGRIVEFPAGSHRLMGFIENGEPGGFGGVIADPIPLVVDDRGWLVFDVEQSGAGRNGGTSLHSNVAHHA